MDNEYKEIDSDEIEALIATGEFSGILRNASERVLVVLTQSWCPQWFSMKMWLPSLCADITVYVLVYDRHSRFKDILKCKEEKLGNSSIPYLRYYRNGMLVFESNYVSAGSVRDVFGIS